MPATTHSPWRWCSGSCLEGSRPARLLERLAGAAVEPRRSVLEGGHHPAYSLAEQRSNNLLQQHRAELEIDVKVDNGAAAWRRFEDPVVVQVPERAVRIDHVDPVRSPIESDAAREPFAQHLEADHEAGPDLVAVTALYPRSHAPG